MEKSLEIVIDLKCRWGKFAPKIRQLIGEKDGRVFEATLWLRDVKNNEKNCN